MNYRAIYSEKVLPELLACTIILNKFAGGTNNGDSHIFRLGVVDQNKAHIFRPKGCPRWTYKFGCLAISPHGGWLESIDDPIIEGI